MGFSRRWRRPAHKDEGQKANENEDWYSTLHDRSTINGNTVRSDITTMLTGLACKYTDFGEATPGKCELVDLCR